MLGATFARDSLDDEDTTEYLHLNGNILLNNELLPKEIQTMAGMQSPNGEFSDDYSSLVDMNDDGRTFAEIADVIEQTWQKL